MTFEKQSKGIKGGKREGAGRKAGVPNKKTAELQAKVAEEGITPLDFLLEVMRDVSNDQKERIAAAIASAPYIHPKLSAIELSGNKDNPLEMVSRVELVALKPNDDSQG